MKKFSIIISQGGNASHKEECNNIKKIHEQGGMQKFMDKEECKNSTNGPCCGAHRSVLVTGFYSARYFVGMFVTSVPIEAHYSVVSVCNEL
jgi:hypothetical protein